jgi:hypothetical protein
LQGFSLSHDRRLPFPPQHRRRPSGRAIIEILAEPVPERRERRNPRVIKRKMSNWPVKRHCHFNPPRPIAPTEDAIAIIAA